MLWRQSDLTRIRDQDWLSTRYSINRIVNAEKDPNVAKVILVANGLCRVE